ncbi:hypothetical protein [Pseudochrobactrum saccharolyticum]|nr:hypothetical protein [Pseudochrobactrum saccharolyticum]MDP8252606.1 hypothetical protein [Pseudochrobactrum saccharolyticum]
MRKLIIEDGGDPEHRDECLAEISALCLKRRIDVMIDDAPYVETYSINNG